VSKKTLNTYDIASYNIELEYNKQIDPIEKAIEKLHSSHESKSLKAHKDFLKREQKSKTEIAQLQEKSVLKHQRIERAVDNKIKKLDPKVHRAEEQLDETISEFEAQALAQINEIHQAIDDLKQEEQEQVNDIKKKYKTNIESYIEKLDIYNNNYASNKQKHRQQITSYQEQLNNHIAGVKSFYDGVVAELEDNLTAYLVEKEQSDNVIARKFKETSRKLSNETTAIRKDANVYLEQINDYVDNLQTEYSSHYNTIIERIESQIDSLKQGFEQREALIETDLAINVDKLETQLSELEEDADKKIRRSLEQKRDLFQLRAATTIRYEQRLLDQQLLLLERELKEMKTQAEFEEFNCEKLRVFLEADETSKKDASEHYKNLNLQLRTHLDSFEQANNDYIYKHEQLKSDFIKEYTNIFAELKFAAIELAQSYLEKIADNNHAIDEINTFIDTAEPLKEIEVNRLREDIEINEVHERFKIKYAKQQYEIDLINAQLDFDKQIADTDYKESYSEYQKMVAEIRYKETYDKAIETAKLKHKKAELIYQLRTNSIQLERRLLESKYKTEDGIFKEEKKRAAIEIRRSNALKSKEIDNHIQNIKLEADYKVEVIQKRLEEDLLKLEDQLNKMQYQKDAYHANMEADIDEKRTEIKQRQYDIERQFNDKLNLIDKALERELKQPTKNKLKTEAVIDERLSKLDVNNVIFSDYITHSIDAFQDDKLSLEQIQEVIVKDTTILDKTIKYLERTYQVYVDAVTFMNEIEERNLLHQISATSDQSKIRRYQRQIEKISSDRNKELMQIQTQQADHNEVMSAFVSSEIQELQRANPVSVQELIKQTDLVYNKIFAKLSGIQERIKESIQTLYAPLTKQDNELIEYATKNATLAKEKVEQERAAVIAPIEQELIDYIASKEAEETTFFQDTNKQLAETKAQVQHLKNDALAKTKAVKEERDQKVNQANASLSELESAEGERIARAEQSIDEQRAVFEDEYKQASQKLDDKEDEATKIFDYENRIFTIASESAASRYDDSLLTAKQVHLNNLKQYKALREQAKQQKDAKEHQLNQALFTKTKVFEKNIFTVRPRLEESIGDAQKEIENQIAEKMEQLSDLKLSNQRLIHSAENRLFTAYQEATDKLSENLQRYIEKYRLIEEGYSEQNERANGLISENNTLFNHALRTLNKEKHQATLEQLLAINKDMFEKEV
jgi:hypothetical protein